MSISNSANVQNEGEIKSMKTSRKLEQVSAGVGWGLFLILVGVLFLADNRGLLQEGRGWSYFVIGIGGIFVIGFFVQFFGAAVNRWSGIGGLVAGLALISVGIAFLNGFGDWWPLVLVAVGVAFLFRGLWQQKFESHSV
jgi:hypothetical protein